MSSDPFTIAVREFHRVFEAAQDQPITDSELLKFRLAYIDEEVAELKEAAWLANADPTPENKAKLLRELADVVYVAFGMAVSFGLPLQEGFERVHAANMSKLIDGKPMRNAQGKVIKGPNFIPPQLEDLVA
jgi:predicted HAD superfamily Cof-like phosphohydrolase